MPRCCSDSCNCKITGGTGIQVLGSGTASDPIVINSVSGIVQVADTSTIDMTLAGSGTSSSPYVLSAAATVRLTNLLDVNTTNATVGYVLARQTGGTFAMVPATTAAVGAINHDTSLTGDGSAGNQLKVVPDTELQVSATGVALSNAARHLLVRQFADTTARTAAAAPAPTLNDLSSLQSVPGVVSWYDGSAWHPLNSVAKADAGLQQFFAITGPYVTEAPITLMTRYIQGTTDASGLITLLSATDLAAPVKGVLSCQVTEVGSGTSYQVQLATTTGPNQVQAKAYHGDTGLLWASLAVQLCVTAFLY